MHDAPAIHVRDVRFGYVPGQHVLRGISFEVAPGQSTAIMGPSGGGKSTLLKLIAGFERPESGEIRVDGRDPGQLSPRETARFRAQAIGLLHQTPELLPTLSAEENVSLPMIFCGGRPRDARHEARGLLLKVGLQHLTGRYPHEMSGGEAQRVALCRALVTRAPVILADEPTGNLDSANGALVLKLLLDESAARGQTVVLITHSEELASHCGRVLRLRDGLLA